jgi:hypothetical protein
MVNSIFLDGISNPDNLDKVQTESISHSNLNINNSMSRENDDGMDFTGQLMWCPSVWTCKV